MENAHSEYERLIAPIEDMMVRSVWRILRDPDDADEAFQNALETVWKRWRRVCRHPNPQALVLRICVNAAYDTLRKKIRRRQRIEVRAISIDPPDRSSSPSDLVAGEETRIEVVNAIGKLPRRQAQAALMRFVQDLPYSDIASALGCSEVTVRKHISRARTRLRDILSHLAPQSATEVRK